MVCIFFYIDPEHDWMQNMMVNVHQYNWSLIYSKTGLNSMKCTVKLKGNKN